MRTSKNITIISKNKTTHQNPSEPIRTHQNPSENKTTHQNPSENKTTHQNPSENKTTHQNLSEPIRKQNKNKFRMIVKTWKKNSEEKSKKNQSTLEWRKKSNLKNSKSKYFHSTRQSPCVETGAFSWRVEGSKLCLRFSIR